MPVSELPPHDIVNEMFVLGTMLMFGEVIEEAQTLLCAGDFYREPHRIIFDVCCELYNKRQAYDFVAVRNVLENRGQLEQIGGWPYIVSLTSDFPARSYWKTYAGRVAECSARRKLIEAAAELNALAHDLDVPIADVINTAQSSVMAVHTTREETRMELIEKPLLRVFNAAEDVAEHGSPPVGLLTGFDEWDKVQGGMKNGDLIIIAARTGIGKTALALSIAGNVSIQQQKRAVMFSLEMSNDQIGLRFLTSHALISPYEFTRGRLAYSDSERTQRIINELYEARFHVCDRSGINVNDMYRETRRVIRESGGVGLVVVDYLQLMRGTEKLNNRVQEIGSITRGLKNFAREMELPVIALCQLSREAARSDDAPQLYHLRESGDIENDADLVIGLRRPASVITIKNNDGSESPSWAESDVEQLVEAWFLKHRGGNAGGFVSLGFIPKFTRFKNYGPLRKQRTK